MHTPSDVFCYVKNTIEIIKEMDFDSIICCGCSGALIAPTVAYLLNKQIAFVRKQEGKIAGTINTKYIIIDDIIESSKTIHKILEAVKKQYPNATCIGICCYTVVTQQARRLAKEFNIPLLENKKWQNNNKESSYVTYLKDRGFLV
jgi:adenine/guanine phosphoribosyltransferase-like PRPP-binding protein